MSLSDKLYFGHFGQLMKEHFAGVQAMDRLTTPLRALEALQKSVLGSLNVGAMAEFERSAARAAAFQTDFASRIEQTLAPLQKLMAKQADFASSISKSVAIAQRALDLDVFRNLASVEFAVAQRASEVSKLFEGIGAVGSLTTALYNVPRLAEGLSTSTVSSCIASALETPVPEELREEEAQAAFAEAETVLGACPIFSSWT